MLSRFYKRFAGHTFFHCKKKYAKNASQMQYSEQILYIYMTYQLDAVPPLVGPTSSRFVLLLYLYIDHYLVVCIWHGNKVKGISPLRYTPVEMTIMKNNGSCHPERSRSLPAVGRDIVILTIFFISFRMTIIKKIF